MAASTVRSNAFKSSAFRCAATNPTRHAPPRRAGRPDRRLPNCLAITIWTPFEFRALKVWMMLKEHGVEEFGRLIDQNIAQFGGVVYSGD
ncbi:MAG: hypothetical protein JWS10_130 [Cypionkella sp.]|nr:hypothetical protein [Cypionkella sp.]